RKNLGAAMSRPLRRGSQEGNDLSGSMTAVPVALAARRTRPLISWRVRQLMVGYSYLLPAALCMLATVVVPIGMAMKMSLYNDVLYKPQEYQFIGIGNYVRLAQDAVFCLTQSNSFARLF